MNLKQYIGKNVSISANNGNIFKGVVDDFFYADETDTGADSIVVQTKDGGLIEFTENDIANIKII
jgi:hypothetical protein